MPSKLYIYELRRVIAAVLFPSRCPFCGRVVSGSRYYCDDCYRYLPFAGKNIEPPPNISKLFVCCYYMRRVRWAVHMLKFRGMIYPADTFALMMSDMLVDADVDVLVPVASGRRSVRNRGFSTADLLAKRISIRLNIPVEYAVKAASDKAEQKTLSAGERYENAKNGFFIDPRVDVRGKRVMLIDDVSTTGSTLSAIGALLLEAGAADVQAAVFAKTPEFARRSGVHRMYRIVRKKGENNA